MSTIIIFLKRRPMKWILQLWRRRKFLLGTWQGGHSPRPKSLVQPSLRALRPLLPPHTSPGPVGQPSRRPGCLWQGFLKPQNLQAVALLPLKERNSLAPGQRPVPPVDYLPPVNTPASLFQTCRGRESSWLPSSGM